jgi:hypothetical protein
MIHPPKQGESQNHTCGNPSDSGFWQVALQRYRLNLNHLTLPEIKDFNALGDRFCFREKAKRVR